jgi:hypothetical protein
MTVADKSGSREVDFKDVTEQEALAVLEVRLLPCGRLQLAVIVTVMAL